MHVNTALPIVRLGRINGVDVLMPKYEIGQPPQHMVADSTLPYKKGKGSSISNKAIVSKHRGKGQEKRKLQGVFLTVLAASIGYAGKATAQVYVNDGNSTSCVEIVSHGNAPIVGNITGNDCSKDLTQTTHSLFYDYKNLVLGGALYVNEGKLGVSDIAGGSYSVRLGNLATTEAMVGGSAIAIGAGETNATVADSLRGIAIGATASSKANDAIALGSNASSLSTSSIAIGNGAGTSASAANGVAIGTFSHVSVRNGGVALGLGSLASVSANVSGYDPKTKKASEDTSATWKSVRSAVSIGNVTGTTVTRQITGLAAGYADTDAVNVAQLKSLAESVSGGWDLTVSGANSSNVALGKSVDLKNTDENLLISKTGDSNDVTFNLARNLKLDGLTAGNTVINTDGVKVGDQVALNSTGLVITGGPSVTSTGIDAGNQKIARVAAGTQNTDAVNFGQLQSVNDTASKGWNLTASGASSSKVEPGASVDLKNTDKNLLISKTGSSNDVTFNLADELNVKKLITGTAVMNADGVKVGDQVALNSTGLVITGGPSVTSTGIDAGNQKIARVAAGTQNTDAVNFGQLQSVNDTASKGWNLTASGASSSKVEPGASVDLKNTDKNLLISKTGSSNDVTFNLADELNVKKLTSGTTVMNADGVKVGDQVALNSTGLVITGGPSVTSTGIDAGNQKIAHVAAGTQNTDAVNFSQLKSVSETASKGWNLTASGTHSSKVEPGASVDLKNTDKNLLISKTGSSNDVTFNLADELNVKKLTSGTTVMNADGVKVGDQVALSATGLMITGGPKVTSTGIDAGNQKITHVTPGTEDTDAVNFSQLKSVSETASKGWNLTASGTHSSKVEPGASVDLRNEDNNLLISKAGDSNDVTFNLADELNVKKMTIGNTVMHADGVKVGDKVTLDLTGLLIDDGPKVTSTGIHAGNQKITHVAAGTEDTDAVNLSQLQSVSETASKGWNLTASGTHSSKVEPGASVDLRNEDNNLLISKAGDSNDVTFNLADELNVKKMTIGTTVMNTDGVKVGTDVMLGSSGLVIAGGPSVISTGINAGNQKITHVAAGTEDTDAVNLSQLKSVKNTANQGWNLTASGTHSSKVAPDASVDLKNTDNNLLISKAGDSNDVTFNLADELHVKKLTSGTTVMNTDGVKVGTDVMLGSTGLVIAGGPSVISTGINAGNKRITHLLEGTDDTDAVNVSQLKRAVENVATNLSVKPTNYYSTNDGGIKGDNYDGNGATGIGAVATGVGTRASGEGATAIGSGAAGNGKGSTAIGHNAIASADRSVALGDGAQDGGRGAESYTGKYSGVENKTVGTVSVGDAAKGETRTISNVADAKEATDAVNLRQLDYVAQQTNRYVDDKIQSIGNARSFVKVNDVNSSTAPTVTGVDATAIGVSSTASGVDSLAVGKNANVSAENAIAIGSSSTASGVDSLAVGKNANVSAENAVALGANSVADRANSVSVGSASAQRQVTNVAAGTAGTDAVNVNQLNQGLITAKQYTDGMLGSLRRDTNAGVAAAIATANLPQAYVPGRGMTSVGISSYQGQSAIAVGVSTVSENGRWVFKFSGSANTRSQVGVGAGVGYQW